MIILTIILWMEMLSCARHIHGNFIMIIVAPLHACYVTCTYSDATIIVIDEIKSHDNRDIKIQCIWYKNVLNIVK